MFLVVFRMLIVGGVGARCMQFGRWLVVMIIIRDKKKEEEKKKNTKFEVKRPRQIKN